LSSAEEENVEEKQQQLFGSLLGFKIGDRVKRRRRVSYYYRKVSKFYWEYGQVVGESGKSWDGQPRVFVNFSGESYSCSVKVKDLVRCRKYTYHREEDGTQ